MFINKICKETGCPPSFDEMKDAIGLKSKSGIHAMIEALVERNFLKRIPHKARALEVVRLPKLKPSAIIEEEQKREQAIMNGMVAIPLYGKSAAGQPIEAIADETESIYVPYNMVSKGSHYALKVEGESMVGAGILDGDTVVINKCDCADEGSIVVALVDNNEATLKIFKR
ncbi:MAG: transcriptional repressor LexA, partial [Alphaproteobacteria bacterium]|nr:transcriptional repressor LexA [Alphaproteobacteria bacterium]